MEPEVLRQFVAAALPTPGVVGSGDLLVGAPGGMFVSVAAGFGVVPGADVVPTQGSYIAFNDASFNVAVTPSNGTNPRIDLVILTVQDAFYQGAVNAPSFQVIAGTPAGSPVAPAVPVAFRDFILLASVLVPALSGAVTGGNITDWRKRAGGLGITRLGASILTVQQTGVGSTATGITGLTVPVIVVANRRLRFTMQVQLVTGAVACPTAFISLLEDGVVFQSMGQGLPASSYGAVPLIIERVPAAGAHTYTGTVTMGAGTVNAIGGVGFPALYVDDVGPA
jgi:hypothetical protein